MPVAKMDNPKLLKRKNTSVIDNTPAKIKGAGVSATGEAEDTAGDNRLIDKYNKYEKNNPTASPENFINATGERESAKRMLLKKVGVKTSINNLNKGNSNRNIG